MFMRLARALERFNVSLLPNLAWRYTRVGAEFDNSEAIQHELSLAGLVTALLTGSGTLGGAAHYVSNELGKEFLRIGFETTGD